MTERDGSTMEPVPGALRHYNMDTLEQVLGNLLNAARRGWPGARDRLDGEPAHDTPEESETLAMVEAGSNTSPVFR
jgi:hypothetical protein